MLNLSSVLVSPAFNQTFNINRTTTSFVVGGVSTTTTTIQANGVVIPDPADLDQMAGGDRVTGAIKIYTSTQIYETNPSDLSDTISWNGQTYRVSSVSDFSLQGFWKAKAVRIAGE